MLLNLKVFSIMLLHIKMMSVAKCSMGESEFTSEQPLNRENEQGTSFEAAEIAALMEEHRGVFDRLQTR
jgi:hypothetical protein